MKNDKMDYNCKNANKVCGGLYAASLRFLRDHEYMNTMLIYWEM